MNGRSVLLLTSVSLLILGRTVVFAVDSNNKSEQSVINEFKPADVYVGIVEDPKTTTVVTEKEYTMTTNAEGTLAVDKSVEVLNVDATNYNSTDAFIRATIVPMWVTDNSEDTKYVVGAMDNIINDDDAALVSIANVQDPYQKDNNNEYLDIPSFDMTSIKAITNNSFTLGDVTFTLAEGWDDSWLFNPKDGYFYYKYVVPVGEKTKPLLASVSINDSKLYRHQKDPISLQVDVLADSVQSTGDAIKLWKDFGIKRTVETNSDSNVKETHPYGYVLELATEDS